MGIAHLRRFFCKNYFSDISGRARTAPGFFNERGSESGKNYRRKMCAGGDESMSFLVKQHKKTLISEKIYVT